MGMIGLVDADILLFRTCFAAERKSAVQISEDEFEIRRDVAPVSHAIQNTNTVIKRLEEKFDKLEFHISGKNNFRKEIATIKPYKGNRSQFQRPVHLDAVRDYLIQRYDTVVADGVEADDTIGIRATDGKAPDGQSYCIVSTDKDLRQIAGKRYNWVKDEWEDIDEREAMRVFYRQLLTGDPSDNIPGVEGIGPVNAGKIVDPYTKESGMWQAVLAEYVERYPDGFHGVPVKKALMELGQLLWIQRTGRIKWFPPGTKFEEQGTA